MPMSTVDWTEIAQQWLAEHDPEGADLWKQTKDTLTLIGWAEEEVARAQAQHPAEADLLHHSLMLLQPQELRGVRTEMVFRGHARELLSRVASGADTRPGTAAEVCCLLLAAATRAPLTTTAVGLLFRMWAKAFPEVPMPGGDQGEHYEAIRAGKIDDAEAQARRGLAVAERRAQNPKKQFPCCGKHHGVQVECRFAEPPATFYRPA
jgi:hypothetical protein